MTHTTAPERITNSRQHIIQESLTKMDKKDIQCQGDGTPQDPPNSPCTVISDNSPESKSQSKSNLHLKTSATLDERFLRKRKRILLSCHKQILAKVREHRLVSKNRHEKFSERSPTLIPIDEQFQNDSDPSPLIVSVKPISQTVSGNMKLSYTIKDGLLSTSSQGVKRSTCIEIPENETSIPAATNFQDVGPECLEQMKKTQFPKGDTSIPTETNLQEAWPVCLEQMKITQYPIENTSIPAEINVQETRSLCLDQITMSGILEARNLQDVGSECLEQMKKTEFPKDDTSIPAGTNLPEAEPICLGQIRIPGIFEDDPSIPAGTILPEIWAERLGQIRIPVCLHGNQIVPAENLLQLPGIEYLEQFSGSFQDDPNGLGRAVGEIQNNCSSSLENLEWVRSLGHEKAITVLYTSRSFDHGINDKHENKVIEEQYLQPVKKRKVKK